MLKEKLFCDLRGSYGFETKCIALAHTHLCTQCNVIAIPAERRDSYHFNVKKRYTYTYIHTYILTLSHSLSHRYKAMSLSIISVVHNYSEHCTEWIHRQDVCESSHG